MELNSRMSPGSRTQHFNIFNLNWWWYLSCLQLSPTKLIFALVWYSLAFFQSEIQHPTLHTEKVLAKTEKMADLKMQFAASNCLQCKPIATYVFIYRLWSHLLSSIRCRGLGREQQQDIWCKWKTASSACCKTGLYSCLVEEIWYSGAK